MPHVRVRFQRKKRSAAHRTPKQPEASSSQTTSSTSPPLSEDLSSGTQVGSPPASLVAAAAHLPTIVVPSGHPALRSASFLASLQEPINSSQDTASNPEASSSNPGDGPQVTSGGRQPLPAFQSEPPDPVEHGTIVMRGGFGDPPAEKKEPDSVLNRQNDLWEMFYKMQNPGGLYRSKKS